MCLQELDPELLHRSDKPEVLIDDFVKSNGVPATGFNSPVGINVASTGKNLSAFKVTS